MQAMKSATTEAPSNSESTLSLMAHSGALECFYRSQFQTWKLTLSWDSGMIDGAKNYSTRTPNSTSYYYSWLFW